MPCKYIFQGVGMLYNGGFSYLKWGADEPRECRFVFIGRNLDRDALIAGVMACKVDPAKPLRFKVGDAVQASRGDGYVPGTVVQLWDEGNPYLIKLDDGQDTHVWGPKDDDSFVKAGSTNTQANKRQKTEG